MSATRIYRVTSIGRPLEPAVPTNRAVLRLLPLAALLGGGAYGLRHGLDWPLLWAALAAALAAFGSWALARELAPDHDRCAFAAMAIGLATVLVLVDSPILPLFLALFLVRIVNRTVGLPARPGDSVGVAALAVAGAWLFASPWLAMLAALAFLLDASLPPGLPRQRVFALVCAVAGVWLFSALDAPSTGFEPLGGAARWLPVAIAAVFVLVILLTRRVEAVGDATGEPLSVIRVRAGMWVGLFAAAQSLLAGPEEVRTMALVWATLAGAALHRPRSR